MGRRPGVIRRLNWFRMAACIRGFGAPDGLGIGRIEDEMCLEELVFLGVGSVLRSTVF